MAGMQERDTLQSRLEGDDLQRDETPDGSTVFVHTVNDKDRLERFLMLGCSDGTYYATTKVTFEMLKKEKLDFLERLIKDVGGEEVVRMIKTVSKQRRNARAEPLIFVYAFCARNSDPATKRAAYGVLTEICRIPTHLFMFLQYCQELSKVSSGTSGWGRAHKRAVSTWYTQFENNPKQLIHLVSKYKSRQKWSHKDAIRKAHIKCPNDCREVSFILRYITSTLQKAETYYKDDQSLGDIVSVVRDYESARKCTAECIENLINLINKHRMSWEQCPSALLVYRHVWSALLPHMPTEALIRNLGRMSKLGLFSSLEGKPNVDMVVRRLDPPGDEIIGDDIRKPTLVHPFKILIGCKAYKTGKGRDRKMKSATDGKVEKYHQMWIPNRKIVDALYAAFYKSFEEVTTTKVNYFLAVNIRGSMKEPVLGSEWVNCATAAAAMMVAIARTNEPDIDVTITCFGDKIESMKDLQIEKEDKLNIVVKKIKETSTKETEDSDCALPIKYAIEQKKKDIDAFVIYTDNKKCTGNVNAMEALRRYRDTVGRQDVKLVVCGMCATECSIADPKDKKTLNVVGFDPFVHKLITDFVTTNAEA